MPAANILALRATIDDGIRRYTGIQVRCEVSFAGDFPVGSAQEVRRALRDLLLLAKRQNFSLVFVVLPSKSNFNYSMLKTVADAQVGIQTVCTVIDDNNMIKTEVGEIANLLLKANMKLGGINHRLQQQSKPRLLTARSIIIGLDVTHPGMSAMKGAPSVAAIVGTRGDDFFRYSGYLRRQTHDDTNKKAVEELLHLKDMMKMQLNSYSQDNGGVLPDHVFVYRDGVGDSHLQIILEREIAQMKQAFAELYAPDKIPRLVVLVAQKRHHVRFFQDKTKPSHNEAFDGNGNLKPGFVHDSQIVSERYWDFYLNSHRCIQGTTRPCRYIVIHKDFEVTPDDIEELTHRLTWLFGRSTTSISISPAARYADMLCDRARCYMHDVYTGGPTQTYNPLTFPWDGAVASGLEKSMFFV